jgi:hypothetical protein
MILTSGTDVTILSKPKFVTLANETHNELVFLNMLFRTYLKKTEVVF